MTTKINNRKELGGYISRKIYSAYESGFYPIGNYQRQVHRIEDILEKVAGGETSYPIEINTTKTISGSIELIKIKGKNQSQYNELKEHHIW